MTNFKEELLGEAVEIHFKDIYPVWENFLWPGRKSLIEKTSTMKWKGGYDMDYLNRTPFFCGIWKEEEKKNLIGVCSCFPTDKGEFRMRGLWVHPEYRNRGLSKILAKKIIDHACLSGANKLWSLPRVSLKPLYIKFGFSYFFGPTNEFEFGPHYYAMMDIRSSSKL